MNFLPLSPGQATTIHSIIEMLAIFVAMQIYWRIRPKNQYSFIDSLSLLCGALFGALIFSKLLSWINDPLHAPWMIESIFELRVGQSIVGGLIGGFIGIEIAKKIVGIKYSTGDAMVLPLVVGISIGRIGCFLAGLHDGTYGVQTTLPWGVDFGDGISRHPTQLYEILFLWLLYFVLHCSSSITSKVNGLKFKIFLASYLLWRLVIDFIKPVNFSYPFGLSAIQIACIVFIIFYGLFLLKDIIKLIKINK